MQLQDVPFELWKINGFWYTDYVCQERFDERPGCFCCSVGILSDRHHDHSLAIGIRRIGSSASLKVYNLIFQIFFLTLITIITHISIIDQHGHYHSEHASSQESPCRCHGGRRMWSKNEGRLYWPEGRPAFISMPYVCGLRHRHNGYCWTNLMVRAAECLPYGSLRLLLWVNIKIDSTIQIMSFSDDFFRKIR